MSLRSIAWMGAVLILLFPLVAMPFTNEVHWTGSDFVFAAFLLFIPLGIYELVTRKPVSSAYRAGVGVALGAAVLLLWINGAVGITDSEADSWYALVLIIGLLGTLAARFRARGMAWAMCATAFSLATVGVIALATGIIPAYNSAFEILGLTGLFAGLFSGSAFLFWKAERDAR